VRSWQQAYEGLLPDSYLDTLSVDQRENLWVEVLLCSRSHVLIAVENQVIFGFLSFGPSRDQDADTTTAEIAAMYVEPRYWHKGIGSALWRECCIRLHSEGYQTVSLWVVAGNTRGIGFYEAMGFEQEDGMVEPCEIAGITLLEQRYSLKLGS